jgi:metal-responsive CopG/Arc/MetJ family transcriptional regulator
MKTAISIPDPLFTSADALAKRLGMSRSRLYATAVAEFVAKQRHAKVTERLNAVYATEDSRLPEDLRRASQRALLRLEW